LLSLDVRLSLDAVLDDRAAFLRFLAQGSVLSLGIIPTDLSSSYDVEELVESVEAALRATVPRSLRFEEVLARMPLTPACGLAMRTVVDAERIFDQLRAAQRELKAVAEPESAATAAPAGARARPGTSRPGRGRAGPRG